MAMVMMMTMVEVMVMHMVILRSHLTQVLRDGGDSHRGTVKGRDSNQPLTRIFLKIKISAGISLSTKKGLEISPLNMVNLVLPI